MPTAIERSTMTAEELRQGYRLACIARPRDDCVIRLAFPQEKEISIISDMMPISEMDDYISQQKKDSENRTTTDFYAYEKEQLEEEKRQEDAQVSTIVNKTAKAGEITKVTEMETSLKKAAVIAVDLGTTTIAMQLMEIDTGRILDTYCELNPQRSYGADVLSRIQASCAGHREKLEQLVLHVLERGVDRFRRKRVHISCMCIAGNTVMEHLFMGYDVLSLGHSPFTPVEIGLQEYLHPGWEFKVWLTPGISAFVGGDIVAGLYALNLLPGQAPLKTASILVDLGTNGEMAITDGEKWMVTATAAGPAFEGGAGAGVIGSDMIASAADLLRQGILDETGLLAEPFFSEGISVGEPPVLLRNKDIRDLQMAKAAVRAGIEILWKKMGQPRLAQVYLAGGFGYYLNPEAAFRIGLLPESMRGKVLAVGNTSLAGAFRIGRDLLCGKIGKDAIEECLLSIISINLAEQEEFEELYVQCMDFRNSAG